MTKIIKPQKYQYFQNSTILSRKPSTAAESKTLLDILSHLCQNTTMQLVRTTLRLDRDLKKTAEMLALKNDQSFQDVVETALREHLNTAAKNEARILFLPSHDLGTPLDNLTRDDFYDEPNFS